MIPYQLCCFSNNIVMGNDGGVIVKKRDLLSLSALGDDKAEYRHDAEDDELTRASTCALSSLPLNEHKHIVSDYKGNLFLKEKILEFIVERRLSKDKDEDNKAFCHIRSLNDLIEVKIKWTSNEEGAITMQCPFSGELKNGRLTFGYTRPCGCVLSLKLFELLVRHDRRKENEKRLERNGISACPLCGKSFCFEEDVVALNPKKWDSLAKFNERSMQVLRDQGLAHNRMRRKASKKRKFIESE